MTNNLTLILGIDPGTLRTGYGIITLESQPTTIGHGVIRPKSSLPLEARLHLIHQDLLRIIHEHAPDIIAVEDPYFGKSAKSSMAVGQAQAVALIAAASQHIPLRRFPPAQVKQRATNSGRASKDDIRLAVQAQLQLPHLPESDAADALAIALCAVATLKEEAALNAQR